MPETVQPPAARPRHRPQRVSFDHGERTTTLVAALARTATGRLGNRARMLGGVVALATGLLLVAAAMEDPDLATFLVGGGLAGAGVLFKAALAAFVGLAAPGRRREAASSLFVVAYLGLIVPARHRDDQHPLRQRADGDAVLRRGALDDPGRYRHPRPPASR